MIINLPEKAGRRSIKCLFSFPLMKLHSFQLNDDSMINIVAAARAEEEFSISKTPRQYENKNFPYRPVPLPKFLIAFGTNHDRCRLRSKLKI